MGVVILYIKAKLDILPVLEKIKEEEDVVLKIFSLDEAKKKDVSDFDIVIGSGDEFLKLVEKKLSYKKHFFTVLEIANSPNLSMFVRKTHYFIERIGEDVVRKDPMYLFRILKRHISCIGVLQENMGFISIVLSLVGEGVCFVSLDWKILESNARFVGFTKEELVGRSIFEFMDEGSIKTTKKYMEMAKEGEFYTFDVNLINKRGKSIPIQITGTLHRREEGELFYIAILTDISAKKEIWEKEQFLSHLIDTSGDAFIVLNSKNHITLWNKSAEEIFGYKYSEVVGKAIDCVLKSENGKCTYLIDEVKKKGRLRNIILECIRKDGAIAKVEVSLSALVGKEGEDLGVSATIRDISKVQKSLEDVQRKNEEMEHLINVVSHDIRSPLTSIDNYLNLLKDFVEQSSPPEEIMEIFERVYANLSNIDAIVKSLTEFSRVGMDVGDEVAVDLNSVVDDIILNIEWQVGKGNLKAKVSRLPTMRMNPSRIQQIFENLIYNAYKFRKEGEIPTIEISATEEKGFVKFYVKDNGIGIAPEHHQRIFNLFYRSKEKSVEGTGAGLAIARKIVNAYEGEMWVESEKGKGATFYFTLPASMVVKE